MSPTTISIFPVSITLGFGVLILGWLRLEIKTAQSYKAKGIILILGNTKRKDTLGISPDGE